MSNEEILGVLSSIHHVLDLFSNPECNMSDEEAARLWNATMSLIEKTIDKLEEENETQRVGEIL